MTFTIDFGWWLTPLAVTLASFAWAGINTRPSANPSYGDGLVGIFFYGAALILSLIAWLIWAVIT